MEKIRIFLTDDNDEIRAALHKYLEAQEDMIISGEAANGVEALQRLPECPSDVIILDLIMPQMDGYGAARAIRALDRPDAADIPIVAMTANAFAEDVQKSLEAGMNAHIAKPVDLEILKATLSQLVKQRSRA